MSARSGLQEEIDARYATLKTKLAFAEAPEMGVAELMERQRQGAPLLLCDVRTDEERVVSVLPGALARDAVDAQLDALRATKATVVCVCTIGARSGVATLALRKQGVEAFNLRGGVLAWTHADGPLVDPAGAATRRVHTYSPDWSLQAPGFEAVTFKRAPAARTLFAMLRDKASLLLGRR